MFQQSCRISGFPKRILTAAHCKTSRRHASVLLANTGTLLLRMRSMVLVTIKPYLIRLNFGIERLEDRLRPTE